MIIKSKQCYSKKLTRNKDKGKAIKQKISIFMGYVCRVIYVINVIL